MLAGGWNSNLRPVDVSYGIVIPEPASLCTGSLSAEWGEKESKFRP